MSGKKQIKHWEEKFATYVYNYCNICNISIYFCNIRMKHLQHTSKMSEILQTYTWNIHFQRNISLLLERMEARQRVSTRGNGSGRGAEKMVLISSPRTRRTDLGRRVAGDP
jgi:hypothetical protein